MAGTVVRIGRYRTSSGPDLGLVYDNQQVATFTAPASHPSRLILYRGGTWAGRYSGVPISRLALMWHASDSSQPNGLRPGGVAARTGTFSPTVGYTGGGGGESLIANLESPFLTDANYEYTVAATNSSGILGIAMYQASSISEPNERFFRKDISGNIPVDAVGSSVSNEGQIVAWFEGEVNVQPNTPSSLSPSGSNLLISTNPVLAASFSDPNETLNNGVSWDTVIRTKFELRTGSTSGALVWSKEYANSPSEQAARRTSYTYDGGALAYGTTYYLIAYHQDRGGLWSSAGTTSFSIKSPNSPPYAPDNLTPNSTITGGLSPTLGFRHLDPDGNASQTAQVMVTRASDGAVMWNKPWAASIANGAYGYITYAGSTLAYNTYYYLIARTQDTAGAWGPWSGQALFQITSLSSVDAPTSPSGYQASQTPANIVAKYTHNSGVASQAFAVRLLNSTGGTLGTSGWISKTVASGGNVTITWAETGFSQIGWGEHLYTQVLARDGNGVEASSWSPATAFNINAAPAVPSGLSPNGAAYSARPLLIVTNVTDADPQHSGASLIVKAVLTTSAGTFTRVMPWVAANGRWEYQTTSTDLPTQGSFLNTWQAYSGDGIVWSGGTTTEAGASKSGVANFRYDAVPAVVITSTTSPIETSQPTLTWTSSLAQASYRVRGYMNGTLVYDSGVVTSATLAHPIVGSNFLNAEQWNTGEAIAFEVDSTSTSTLTGTSARVTLLLSYTPPAPLPLSGQSIALPQTTQANAMSLWHEPTSVLNENFEGFVWRRADLSDENDVIEGTEVVLQVVTNSGITQIIDASIVSGKKYRWSVAVRERRGNDIVESVPQTFDGGATWVGIVVHAPDDPLDTAVELLWSTSNGDFTPAYPLARKSQQYESVSGERIFSLGKKVHQDAGGSFEIMDDEAASADKRLATIHYLYRYQSGELDGLPHVACWRSGRGGVTGIIYGMLTDEPVIMYDEDGLYTIDIGIREAKYTLGVTG